MWSNREGWSGETTLAMLVVMQPWMLLAISPAWAHCWLLPSSLPWGLPGSFLQSGSPAHQPVSLQGFIPSHLQDFALAFAEFHEVPVASFLQPVKTRPTLWHIGSSPQFDVLYKHDRNAVWKSKSGNYLHILVRERYLHILYLLEISSFL